MRQYRNALSELTRRFWFSPPFLCLSFYSTCGGPPVSFAIAVAAAHLIRSRRSVGCTARGVPKVSFVRVPPCEMNSIHKRCHASDRFPILAFNSVVCHARRRRFMVDSLYVNMKPKGSSSNDVRGLISHLTPINKSVCFYMYHENPYVEMNVFFFFPIMAFLCFRGHRSHTRALDFLGFICLSTTHIILIVMVFFQLREESVKRIWMPLQGIRGFFHWLSIILLSSIILVLAQFLQKKKYIYILLYNTRTYDVIISFTINQKVYIFQH